MKAVVTVIGKDSVGIIAEVSAECAKHNANIVDITQSVLKDYFAMIMLVEIEKMETEFAKFQKELATLGEKKGLDIRAMHEDIFNSMHRI
ncbi:MAG: ACT domain-containing protein [Clostridia bacterium]|nr:ACT domain-containing protein [Clostridia bacterium]